MSEVKTFPRGAVVEFLRQRFGGLCRERQTDITAGVAAQVLVGNDPERMSLTVMNLGGNEVFIAPGGVVSSTHGIRLAANGGGVSFNVLEDATLPSLDWSIIAAAAGVAVYVLEVRREVLT